MAAKPSLIFITGGVRSGKSSLAEKMAIEIACKDGGQLYYIAAGVPSDQEMMERIQKHQHDRNSGESHWKTIEQPVEVGKLSSVFNHEDIVLLDCVTTLLNNELFSSKEPWDVPFLELLIENIVNGILSIKQRVKTMIVVSNEVLYDPLPGNELVVTYNRLLGKIHQRLVRDSDQAILVEFGVPVVMKGECL